MGVMLCLLPGVAWPEEGQPRSLGEVGLPRAGLIGGGGVAFLNWLFWRAIQEPIALPRRIGAKPQLHQPSLCIYSSLRYQCRRAAKHEILKITSRKRTLEIRSVPDKTPPCFLKKL